MNFMEEVVSDLYHYGALTRMRIIVNFSVLPTVQPIVVNRY